MRTFTKVRLQDWPPINDIYLDLNTVEAYFFRNDGAYNGDIVLQSQGRTYHLAAESTKLVCDLLKISVSEKV
jgi:hypothetical protein